MEVQLYVRYLLKTSMKQRRTKYTKDKNEPQNRSVTRRLSLTRFSHIWERTHRVRKQKITKVILTNGCIVLPPLSWSKCWIIKGIQSSNSGHLSLLAAFDEDKGKKGKLNTVKAKYGYRHQYQKWNFEYNRQRTIPTKAMFQKLSLC